MSPARVTVAVLHHRDPSLLDVVLGSLEAQTFTDFETVVIDDASRDGSAEHLARRWPAVRVVRTGESNVGVTAAFNRAVAAAEGSELLALLNNDMELDPGWLAALVGALHRRPDCASAACRLLNYFDRERIDCVGDVYLRSGAGGKRGHGELDVGQYGVEADVLGPTGGAALYRMSAFERVGVFDEALYAYFEDVDWALRAQRAGLGSVYVPGAVAFHMEGRTTGGTANPRFYALQWRNTLALLIKHPPAGWLARHAPFIAAHQLHGLIRSARRRMLGAHLRGLAAALGQIGRWRAARRELRGHSPVATGEFERISRLGREDG